MRHNLETAQTRELTNYVAVTAPDGIFHRGRATALRDISDGASQTIAITEARNHAVHWMEPDDDTEFEIVIDLQSATDEHHANHLGGLTVLLADGSVRFVSSKTTPKTIHSLVTRNGREPVEDF